MANFTTDQPYNLYTYFRHKGLTLGNIYANRMLEGMTIQEVLQKIEEGDERIIGSLIMFSAQIPGSRGFWKLEMKKLLALQRFIEHFSDGEERINVFMTFSLPDYHMEELHASFQGRRATWAKQ